MNVNLVETTNRHSHFQSITRPHLFFFGHARPVADGSFRSKGNVMRRRVMMILAGAALAGSLLATDAQARGGGGHAGGFGRGYFARVGGFGGARTGGVDQGRIGGFGRSRIEGFARGHMAGIARGHMAGVRRGYLGFGTSIHRGHGVVLEAPAS